MLQVAHKLIKFESGYLVNTFTTALDSAPDVEESPEVVDVSLLDVEHEQLLVATQELLPAEPAVDVIRASAAVQLVTPV